MAEDDVVEPLVVGMLSEFFEEDVGEGFARRIDQGGGFTFDQVGVGGGAFLSSIFDFKFEAFPGAGAKDGGIGANFGNLYVTGFGGCHRSSISNK